MHAETVEFCLIAFALFPPRFKSIVGTLADLGVPKTKINIVLVDVALDNYYRGGFFPAGSDNPISPLHRNEAALADLRLPGQYQR